MARKSSAMGPPPPPIQNGNGYANGDIPPPSTIAAKIVHNHQDATTRQEPESKKLFGQLLQEYLNDPEDTIEKSVETNAKLITVVAEAGLDALLKDNPFAQSTLLSQAIDSLSVIRLTVEKTPDVLLYQETKGVPPVFMALLPKLLALLGRNDMSDLQEPLEALLRSCLRSLSRLPEMWQKVMVLGGVLVNCVDATHYETDIVQTLDTPKESSGILRVTLPPSRTVTATWPEAQHLVALPSGCQTSISSFSQMLVIVASLVRVVMLFTSVSYTITPVDSGFPWAFDNLYFSATRLEESSSMAGSATDLRTVASSVANSLEAVAFQSKGNVERSFRSDRCILSFLGCLRSLLAWVPAPQDLRLQHALARLFIAVKQHCNISTRLSEACEDLLLPQIVTLGNDPDRFEPLIPDLQLALSVFAEPSSSQDWPQLLQIKRLEALEIAKGKYPTEEFRQAFWELSIRPDKESEDVERPAKRQRLDQEDRYNAKIAIEYVFQPISEHFWLAEGNDLKQRFENESLTEILDTPSEERLGRFLTMVAEIPCEAAMYVSEGTSKPLSGDDCIYCNSLASQLAPRSHAPHDISKILVHILEQVTELEILQRSKRLRVLVALVITRIINHSDVMDQLRVSSAPLAQWCMRSLRSSFRELRILAQQALMAFLRYGISRDLLAQNRAYVVRYLHELTQKEDINIQHTLVLAWGQIARICGDEEQHVSILQLVEYLGHTHPLVCGVAFNELQAVAEDMDRTPDQLMKPFWRTIGPNVVRDLHTRPQKAQQLCEFLGIGMNQLLLNTQASTLPYLVLDKRTDILKRIAAARGPNTTLENLCLEPPRNFAAILALLLVHHQPSDPENAVLRALCDVAPGFERIALSDAVKLQPIPTACDLLKCAGDQSETSKPRYHQAIQTLAVITQRQSGMNKSALKPTKLMAAFFEAHIIGIMLELSDVIENVSLNYPLYEKVRALKAIAEVIRLAKEVVSIALPQLRSCLQSALQIDELRDCAFDAWAGLIAVLDQEEIALVLNQFFAIVVQEWQHFSTATQQQCHQVIGKLLKDHNALLRESIDTLPSLATVPVMSKLESEIVRFKSALDTNASLEAFSRRCEDEYAVVVVQALKELVPYVSTHQQFVHESAATQQPSPVIAQLCRSLLEACTRFTDNEEIVKLSSECLGVIGELDPNRIEFAQDRRDIIVLSNFNKADEVIDFVAFMLETVLVKAFISANNTRAQNFLAYVIQELVRACRFSEAAASRPRASQSGHSFSRWFQIPESVRTILTPYMSSKFVLQGNPTAQHELRPFPIMKEDMGHAIWLREFTFALLQRANGDNPKTIFSLLARVIRGQSLSLAEFILPFAAHNVVVGGTEPEILAILDEILLVLKLDVQEGLLMLADHKQGESQYRQYSLTPDDIKRCSENVFQILDYFARWLQAKRKAVAEATTAHARGMGTLSELDLMMDTSQISSVERFLQLIPAHLVSRRARECGSGTRAVFYWEQHMRQDRDKAKSKGEVVDETELYSDLADMYVDLKEPDGMEGLLANISLFDEEKQAWADEKAGRWTEAQGWHEVQLSREPNNTVFQQNLLYCFSQSGRFDASANYISSLQNITTENAPMILPFAAESSWATGKWQAFEKLCSFSGLSTTESTYSDFDVLLATAFTNLRNSNVDLFLQQLDQAREDTLRTISTVKPATYRSASEYLLRFQAIYEIEVLSGVSKRTRLPDGPMLDTLDRRLNAIGANPHEKQYLLNLRRATLNHSQLQPDVVKKLMSSAWLTSARLSRKSNFIDSAYNAVLHAMEYDDVSATLEHCRLLWQDGHHRKAIQTLQNAITADAFAHSVDGPQVDESMNSAVTDPRNPRPQNQLLAKAQLLLAKWTDAAGQTNTDESIHNYHEAIRSCMRWEKCHYYLGKFYLKVLEHEKRLPVNKQNRRTKSGENVKLVVDNFIRALGFGAKYNHQTVPKILTLWLDLGMEVHNISPRHAREPDNADKIDWLEKTNAQLKKYLEKLAAWIFYIAFPQMMSRINHPHPKVWDVLASYILRVSNAYPQQTLWSLLAASKSAATDRSIRAGWLINKLKENTKKKVANTNIDLKTLVTHGSRLCDALLHTCEAAVDSRTSHVSLSRDLGFSHRLAPCGLVVPVQATMNAILPTGTGQAVIKSHKPFARGTVTISSFNDDVLVLSSLQRPRKITLRGSDGVTYGLLCKPKDDLRKDQRLMEFNSHIDRALKKDVEASKRQLYTKTYAVTPLNEEHGIIEWVDGLKPMRDIIINLYKHKGVRIDYNQIRSQLTEASVGNVKIFTDVILQHFQPVLYEWFIDNFPEPERWFDARLRYTRSCAVTSITGHILGLGDRHGENVLLEEGSGGAFHVDFNCLFDKGLTFEKPELVPFRLTHNMVDAFGQYGVEGPFRKSAELTLKVLREHEDTLMTILETFLYDPTADFLGKKKRRIPGVPETPQEVLESVRGKLKGLWKEESVPLSVEGYVDSLIRAARDPHNLAAMYIGWCAFF